MHSFGLKSGIVSALVLFSLVGCSSTQQVSSTSSGGGLDQVSAVSDKNVAVMVVHGMACPQCSYNVDLQLKKVAGVEKVAVNMALGRVEAWLSPSNPPTREQLTKAIEETTFTLVSLRMPGEPAVAQ